MARFGFSPPASQGKQGVGEVPPRISTSCIRKTSGELGAWGAASSGGTERRQV